MPAILDAHAHFFMPGYVDLLPEDCRRIQPDEFTLYAALAARHNIAQVLAVGYEGAAWAAGNNTYLTALAHNAPWLRPVAYVEPANLRVTDLEKLRDQGFVGISLYLMTAARADLLDSVEMSVWSWLEAHAWIVSVNSRGDLWHSWRPVLNRHPTLRLLVAHLGLPPACAAAPSQPEAAHRLAAVTPLAAYPEVHVKLSALYALTEPGYAYPHHAASPYIEIIAQVFGSARLVWGSDFSPALEHVSFAQTLSVVDSLPWFSETERAAILGANLARLLESIPTKEAPP